MCTFHRRLPANKATLSRTKKERGTDQVAGNSRKHHCFLVGCDVLCFSHHLLEPTKDAKFTTLENNTYFLQNHHGKEDSVGTNKGMGCKAEKSLRVVCAGPDEEDDA
ncbi:hypothetical protein HispidOSU_007124 [Sigmodon hispidus]